MRKFLTLFLALCVCGALTSCAKQCDHQFSASVTTKATCQAAGVATYTCKSCGLTFTAETPAADHDFVETSVQEATCQTPGTITYTCTLCGASKETATDLGDHVFDPYSLDPDKCTLCGQTVEGGGVDTANPWYGKKWVALGTSLTSEEQGKYVQPLAQRSGLEVTNYGVPGGTAVGQVLYSAQNAEALPSADLVTVEFGVNDWFGNIPLGTVGDTTPYLYTSEQWNNGGNEAGTFAGACYQIFRCIQVNAPNAAVVFITDPTGQNSGDNCERQQTNGLGLRQRDYAEMAMAVAEYMGVRVIDAGSASMIDQDHTQYLADQIHHTELGGKQYALTIWMELKDMAPLLKEG